MPYRLMEFDDHDHQPKCCWSSSTLAILVAILLFLVIVLTAALCVVVVLNRDTKNGGPCLRPECVEMSAYILKKMNSSARPCDDMYEYACGGWLANNNIPPGYSRWGQFSALEKENKDKILAILDEDSVMFKGVNSTAIDKLRKQYQACLDLSTIEEIGTKPLLKLIEQAGSWTITKDGSISPWNQNTWDLQDVLEKVLDKEASPFLSYSIGPDSKNTSKNVLTVGQAGLSLADQSEYTGNLSQKYKDAYLNYATAIGVLLGGDKNKTRELMTDVYNLEAQLAKIMMPRENFTDPLALYNNMTIRQFQELTGSWINFKKLLKAYYHGRDFLDSEVIIVATTDYFKQLGAVIQATKKETLANYMIWGLVQESIPYMPDSFAKATLLMSKVERGVTSLGPRTQFCVSKVHSSLGMAASALYVDKYFPPSSKEKVTAVIEEVTAQFIQNLYRVEWLDASTRTRMLEKAEAVINMVGYPEWISVPSLLDDHYSKLTIEKGKMFSNWLHIIDYYRGRAIDLFGKPPDKTKWDMNPDQVNAYYNPLFNQIVIPAGILQPPFYDPDFPIPFQYGTIGMVVGHELTHGFDNQGRLYNKYGNLDNLWTDSATHSFNQHASCMVEQYNKYTIHDVHMNGKMTLGENIADNGGADFAYSAYKAKKADSISLPGLDLTDDQMFYLGFSQLWCVKYKRAAEKNAVLTDVHAVGKFRVQGVCSNQLWFERAFECGPDARYNPEHKCKVW